MGAQRQKSATAAELTSTCGWRRKKHTGDVIDIGRLAQRLLVLGGRVADVVSALWATHKGGRRGIDLVGQIRRLWEDLRDERGRGEGGERALGKRKRGVDDGGKSEARHGL